MSVDGREELLVDPSAEELSLLSNGLLTISVNFFAETPDDRALDLDFALARLRTDYEIVEDGFELGDIVALLDEHDDLFHVVVYLAGDLVLTKNGMSPVARVRGMS